MRGTGSIRTATRWSWCSAALALVAATACTTRTTTFFTPTPGQERLSQDEVRDESDDLLAIECPRLMGSGTSAMGEARIRVQYDGAGAVQRAQITRGSGDDRVDTFWGALAARLKFDPQEGQGEALKAAVLTFGYACSPNTAVTTLRLPE